MAAVSLLPQVLSGPRMPSARHVATLWIVATLPLTYALTVSIGFPLKIYEVLLLLLGTVIVWDGRLALAPGVARIVSPLMAFLAWAACVLTVRLALPLASFTTSGFNPRFGPAGDAITKFAYWILAVFAFALVATAAYENGQRVAQWWLRGAIASSVYGWMLFLSSAFSLPAPLLPGMTGPAMIAIGGREFYRGGTFEEGNFFALYLLTSIAVALWMRRPRTTAFFVTTVVITFSTVNMAGLLLLFTVYAFSGVVSAQNSRRRLVRIAIFISATAALTVILAATGYLTTIFIAKLSGEAFASRLDRLDLAVAGLRMALDHPLAGVGLSHYGYNYRPYQLTDVFDITRDVKPIANSPWIELVAETGVIGFGLFAVFARSVWRRTRGAVMLPFRAGVAAVALGLFAFPSITVLFLWAFCGLAVGVSLREAVTPSGAHPA